MRSEAVIVLVLNLSDSSSLLCLTEDNFFPDLGEPSRLLPEVVLVPLRSSLVIV